MTVVKQTDPNAELANAIELKKSMDSTTGCQKLLQLLDSIYVERVTDYKTTSGDPRRDFHLKVKQDDFEAVSLALKEASKRPNTGFLLQDVGRLPVKSKTHEALERKIQFFNSIK